MAQDVTDEAGWGVVVAASVERWGKLDILVNNAGTCILGRVVDFDYADWRRQIEVNLHSVFLGCRAAARQMLRQGKGGSIISMSSISAMVTGLGSSAYSASKAGVHLMTKSLALELASDGIRVNSVHPGMVMTELMARSVSASPESVTTMEASIPLARLAQADEIAPMVAFLASDDARYCTGGAYVVDGGVTTQ